MVQTFQELAITNQLRGYGPIMVHMVFHVQICAVLMETKIKVFQMVPENIERIEQELLEPVNLN